VNLRAVQTPPGHKDLRMTIRYSHLTPKHLKEAVSILERTPTTSDKKEEKCENII
jgi:site-specific recombinase XerD